MAQLDDFKVEMDAANLYREELITDRKMGVIHVLTPVTAARSKELINAALSQCSEIKWASSCCPRVNRPACSAMASLIRFISAPPAVVLRFCV